MSHNTDNDNPTDSDKNSPSDPTSRLSATARLGYFITGGTRRGPSSMASFLKMARDRADAGKGSEAWDAARKEGRERAASVPGPKPKGRALVRWYRENRGGPQDGGRRSNPAGRPAQPMREEQQQPEIDTHGVSDEEQGQRDQEENGAGDGQGEAGGEAERHQQPSGDIGGGHQRQGPDTPKEHE